MLDYDESIRLSKYIMLLPEFKKFTLGGVEFSTDEIDIEAERVSKLPQQSGFDIRVKTISVPTTRKEKLAAKEETYNKLKKIGKLY